MSVVSHYFGVSYEIVALSNNTLPAMQTLYAGVVTQRELMTMHGQQMHPTTNIVWSPVYSFGYRGNFVIHQSILLKTSHKQLVEELPPYGFVYGQRDIC